MADAGETFDIVERDMVPAAHDEVNETLQHQRKKLLDWLQPTDYLSPGNEYMKHLRAYLPGTAKWVHESPIFRSWCSKDVSGDVGTDTDSGYHNLTHASVHGASCLYVRGVAGSGKSVFSASTIDQLQTAGNLVLFFFFRQIVAKNHAAQYLVRDFAAQLLPHSKTFVKELAQCYKQESVDSIGTNRLWAAIYKVLAEGSVTRQVFCVVDALDEMDDADFPDMMEKLIALGSANPQTVKIMFTGRPLPKIEQAVRNRAVLQLKLDPVLLSPDVARYVDARMATLQPRLSDEKCELVRRTICERASGLFLHARLITDNLAHGLQEGRIAEKTLPDSLDRLPRSLREVYEEMLKEHAHRSGVSADHQAKILTCVTHSSRPMRLIELASLVAQMLNADLRRGKELVRASCGRLLELLEDETVSVIHHSFTEFLHDRSRSELPTAFPVLRDTESHDMLVVLCLEYLNTCPHVDMAIDETRETNYKDYKFSGKERDRRNEICTTLRLSHPLAAYAVENLGLHLQKSCKGVKGRGLAAFDCYFRPKHPAFETWTLMTWKKKLTSSINALHLLINFARNDRIPIFLVQHVVMTQPTLLDLPDSEGRTPLILAIKSRREDIVELLLSRGASINTTLENGMGPLHFAVKKGNAGVVQKLLEFGLDPFIKTAPVYSEWDSIDRGYVSYSEEETEEMRKTAFSMAMSGPKSDIALQFIPYMPPGEASAFFNDAQTPEALDALLMTGLIDVNSYIVQPSYPFFDDGQKTKLHLAAASCEVGMVKVLLEHGADPNRREPNQPTALHEIAGKFCQCASLFWYEEKTTQIVQILVGAGADINAPMSHERMNPDTQYSPLHLAVEKDRRFCSWLGSVRAAPVVTEALLKSGADPNSVTSRGNTPLHFADPGQTQLLHLLVSYGADIHRKNDSGQTPFLSIIDKVMNSASGRPLELNHVATFLHDLLDLGADPSIVDSSGNNVFHYLMRSIDAMGDSGFIPLVERCLKAADPNQKNHARQAPLLLYNRKSQGRDSNVDGDEELLRFLVQNGMQLDIFDEKGEPLLHVLWRCLETTGMEKFIRLGADPKTCGPDGKSLFQKALSWCEDGYRNHLEHLLKISATPDGADEEGNTLIHDVLTQIGEVRDAEVALDLVVSAGADPLAKNRMGQSALHVVNSNIAEVAIHSPYFRLLDINEKDISGLTPLHNLVECGEDLYADMLERGGDPLIRSDKGMLALHFASKVGQVGLVDFLLAQYDTTSALLRDINSLGDGLSPLHYACQGGYFETVSVLLRYGADPNFADEKGFTSLHKLAEFEPANTWWDETPLEIRTPEIVHMLCRRGADVNTAIRHVGADGSTLENATALDLAVSAKRWEVVRELLACGAKAPDQYTKSLGFILGTDKIKALETARQMKAKLDSETSNLSKTEMEKRKYNHQPVRNRWAAVDSPPERYRRWILGPETLSDMIKNPTPDDYVFSAWKDALASLDFDTIKEYDGGGSSLETLCDGNGDFIQFLIEHGYEHLLRYFSDQVRLYCRHWSPNYYDRDPSRRFPLSLLGTTCAKEQPSMSLIEWLIDEGAVNIDATHVYKGVPAQAPLHILARGRQFWHLEALEYLLIKGANVEARTHDGLTPLLMALNHRRHLGKWNIEAVRLLLKHGANANARIEEQPGNWNPDWINSSYDPGTHALDLAKDAEAFRLLISAGADKTLCNGVLIRNDPNEKPSNQECHRDYIDHHEEEQYCRNHFHNNVRYALHEAARPTMMDDPPDDFTQRQITMTQLLLAHGADLYSIYPDGSFVLQRIVEDRGQFQACVPCIKRGNLDMRGNGGRTLLIQACIPNIPVARPKKYYAKDKDRPVPTIMADTIKTLLGMGADVTLTDDDGRTALHWFCTQNVPFDAVARDVFKQLIAKNPEILTTRDNKNQLPIHLALQAFSGREPSLDFAIRCLMSFGADPSIPDPIKGDSALHHIARSLVGNEDQDSVEARILFQDLAAVLDVNATNNEGESATAYALGAPFPDRARFYSSAYAKGAKSAYAKLLPFLSGLGARMDTVDAKGRNLLHVATERPINKERSNGAWTEEKMITKLFEALLDFGLDPRKENDDLRTPIDNAVARKLEKVVDLFSEEGKRAAEERKLKKDGDADDADDTD